MSLKPCYTKDTTIIEIGVDESGRGPMFGRVYAGAVVLPKYNDTNDTNDKNDKNDTNDTNDTFDFSLMKDSKKFHSDKKIKQVAQYIKEKAVAWAVAFEDETAIDEINILQACQRAMHCCIQQILQQLQQLQQLQIHQSSSLKNILLLVDGNYFNPFSIIPSFEQQQPFMFLEHKLITKGDNTYCSIAAASILAKTERDEYILQLCDLHPVLKDHYGIDLNKGYGTKTHINGILRYGITQWHRKTFGLCKNYSSPPIHPPLKKVLMNLNVEEDKEEEDKEEEDKEDN